MHKPEPESNAFHENRQVFQSFRPWCNVSINDCEDMIVCTRNMRYRDRVDYAFCQGMDYDRVVMYLDSVKYLDQCWNYEPPKLFYLRILWFWIRHHARLNL